MWIRAFFIALLFVEIVLHLFIQNKMEQDSSNRENPDSKLPSTNGLQPPNAGFALFGPDYDTDGMLVDLLETYPQLKEYDSFNKLLSLDLHFVNFYANPSSPVVMKNLPDNERIHYAMTNAYGEVEEERVEAYLLHQWSEEIDGAISDMKRFNLAYRDRASNTLVRTFDNLIMASERCDNLLKYSTEQATRDVTESVQRRFKHFMGSKDYVFTDNENELIKIIAEEIVDSSPDNMDNVFKYISSTQKLTAQINDTILQIERTGISKKKDGKNATRDIFTEVRKKMSRA